MFIASLTSVGNLDSFVHAFKTAGIRHNSINLINAHSIGIVPPFLSTTWIKTSPDLHLTFYYTNPVEGHAQSFLVFWPECLCWTQH